MPTYNGTPGGDTIFGDQSGVADDIINGLGGNDTLSGLASNDVIDGGTGNDLMSGDDGIDTLRYADAAARIYVSLAITTAQATVGAGIDTISGFENLVGSAYNDQLTGDSGVNIITGGAGNDLIAGGAGHDSLQGEDGTDTIEGGTGNDRLDGGAGNDVASYASATTAVIVSLAIGGAQFTGSTGTDTLVAIEGLTGSAFNDTLTGDDGANILNGGLGNDLLTGGAGDDMLDGGAGVDTATYADAVSGITLNLVSQSAQATGGAGSDTLRNIETIIGSAFNDVLTGNDFANIFTAGDGDDLLNGGLGNDRLDGGAGVDTASYATAAGAVKVSLTIASAQSTLAAGSDTLAGIENLVGGGFDDQLTGNAGDNVLTGNGGADILNGGAGNDLLNGGAATDTASYAGTASGVTVNLTLTGAQDTTSAGFDTLLSIENLTGSSYADVLTGSAQLNVISGGVGNDIIDGGSSNDTLDGGNGNDMLMGGNGDDLLTGGSGNDGIDGGAGFDTISYAAAIGAVTVSASGQVTGGGQNTDSIVNIEHLIGSAYGDSFSFANGSVAVTLDGGDGNDFLTGGAGTDTLNGEAGDDDLSGGAGIDSLFGGDGNDRLGSGTGADSLVGGVGNDVYRIGDSSAVIVETADGGNDVVSTVVSYILPDNVESMSVGGTDSVGLGNDLDNRISAFGQSATIDGRGGQDVLSGNVGAYADIFVFSATAHSTPDRPDRITNLGGNDFIDLSAIDADIAAGGDQAFHLVAGFTSHAAEYTLAFDNGTNTTTLNADTNGDAIADMTILFTGNVTTLTEDWVL